jgi:ribokinase
MPGSVLVVGSINADLVVTLDALPAPGETVIGGRFARHGGGKGANQAVASARAGAGVRFVGAVGDDDFGAAAVVELEAQDIDVGAVARMPDEPTGVALIAVDRDGRNQIAVASGANARVDAAMVEEALEATPLTGADVCLLGFEVPDEAIVAAGQAAARAGAWIVLNPAPARAIPDALLGLGVVLTPNAREAKTLGGPHRLAARTGGPVIVTLGADGALLLDGDNETPLPAPAVDALDTTGAGDAFNGVLAAGLAAGLDLEDAARRAVEAASASVRRAGARG